MKKVVCKLSGFLLAAVIALSGCTMAYTGQAEVEKQSFVQQKQYALITIASNKEYSGEQGFFQMFQDNDEIAGINTQPVIDELVPSIRAKFARTGYFTSVPMKIIVNHQAYKELEEDEKLYKKAFLKNDLNVAKGYKYFADKEKLALLARGLDVDGVICVKMFFSVHAAKSVLGAASSSFLGGIPLSFGSKEYSAMVTTSVTAYDADGNQIWEDTVVKEAEPGDSTMIVAMDFSDLQGTDFTKMHPSSILIAQHSVDVVVQRFKDTMEGKETDSFQRVKDDKTKEVSLSKS